MFKLQGNKLRFGGVGVIAALGLMAGLLGAPAQASAGCQRKIDGPLIATSYENFHVSMQPLRKVYQQGEVARVQVTVTRQVKHARLNPIPIGPANGVQVLVALNDGRSYLAGSGTTDLLGQATVEIPITRQARAGLFDADGYAWRTHVPTSPSPCGQPIEEYGETFSARFLRVAK